MNKDDAAENMPTSFKEMLLNWTTMLNINFANVMR